MEVQPVAHLHQEPRLPLIPPHPSPCKQRMQELHLILDLIRYNALNPQLPHLVPSYLIRYHLYVINRKHYQQPYS